MRRPPKRVSLAVLAGLVLLAWVLAVPSSGVAGSATPPEDVSQRTPESVKIVTVDANSSEQLWPYTSRQRSFDTVTLPINVVVLKDAAYVRYLLVTSTGATWQTDDATGDDASAANESIESGVVLNGSRIEWSSARGSTRYTYLHERRTGHGRWVAESYQLHDGAYLGTRYHLRLYEGGAGGDRWTAIQVHREHWDWFRLRHTVDSVDRAQDYVEREFYGTWFLEHIARDRFANGGALDADGWVTVIRLTERDIRVPPPLSLAVLLWFASIQRLTEYDATRARERVVATLEEVSVDLRYLPLVAALALLPLAVRLAGVTLESTFPALTPKVIAGLLYPLLALGVPLTAYHFSRRLQAQTSSIASAAALGVGMLLDYSYLSISALPISVVVHRTVLLVAVGMIATGSARSTLGEPGRHWLITVGVLAWVLGLVIPLFGLY